MKFRSMTAAVTMSVCAGVALALAGDPPTPQGGPMVPAAAAHPVPIAAPPVPAAAPTTQPAAAGGATSVPGAGALDVQFRAVSLQLEGHADYDEHGDISNETTAMTLSVAVVPPKDQEIVACTHIVISKMVPDAGEPIILDNDANPNLDVAQHQVRLHARGVQQPNQPDQPITINFELPMPGRACTVLKEVSGKMDVTYVAGPVKRAVLEPFSKYEGKHVRIEGIDGRVTICMRRPDKTSVSLEASRESIDQLSEIALEDENGQDFDASERSRSDNQESDHHVLLSYQAPMPDQGRVVLSFYTKCNSVRVPFVIRNVKLPRPAVIEDSVDVVVKAIDPDAHPAEGKGGDLKVTIEPEDKGGG